MTCTRFTPNLWAEITWISSFLRPHHNTTTVNSVGRALNFRYDENEVVCKLGLPVKDSNPCTMDFRFRMAIRLESNNNTRWSSVLRHNNHPATPEHSQAKNSSIKLYCHLADVKKRNSMRRRDGISSTQPWSRHVIPITQCLRPAANPRADTAQEEITWLPSGPDAD